jgi:hypothetical protein
MAEAARNLRREIPSDVSMANLPSSKYAVGASAELGENQCGV